MKNVNSVLNKILIEKSYEVLKRKEKGLYYKPFWNRTPIDFKEYLFKKGFVVIAEIKKASPSRGMLRENLNPVELALSYKKAGAGAISVITEEVYFKGSLEYLSAVREAVDLPLLRKDFIIDPVQLEEAKAFGADIVLLIAGILKKEEFKELYFYARKLGLSVLSEVHSEEELEEVLSCGADIIGINNRNLSTLKVDTENSFKLFNKIPETVPVIAESGYNKPEELAELKKRGFKGVLIGTSLVTAENPEEKLKELIKGVV
jgi:indole-3-glycerol phosphate synthase